MRLTILIRNKYSVLVLVFVLTACTITTSPIATLAVLPSSTPFPATETIFPSPSAPTYTLTPYRTPTITPPASVSYAGALPKGLIGRLGAGHFNQVAASPDGGQMAVASSVGVYIYDSESFEQEQMIPSDDVISIAWSPNGKWIAGGVGGKTIVWDADTGTQFRVLNTSAAYKIRWSPDSNLLAAVVGAGRYVDAFRVWNIDNGTLRYSLEGAQISDQEFIDLDMDWSSTGRLVIAGGEQVRVLDGKTGKLIYQLEYSDPFVVPSVSWSPDGSTLALVTKDSIRLLHADDGSEQQTFVEEDGTILASEVAWSQNGQYLAMSRMPKETYGLAVAIWDVKTSRWMDEFYGHTYPADSLVWVDGDTELVSIQTYGGLLIAWDLETKAPQHVLRGNYGLDNLAWSLDGKTISATDGAHILAWDVSSRKLTLEVKVSADAYMNYAGIRDMALSPDGNRYAVVWGDDGRYLETWGAQTGLQDDLHVEAEPGIDWSPNGKYIVAGTRNGEVKIWDSRIGLAPFEYDLDIRFESPYGSGIDWSPDGKTIAAVSGGRIYLLEFPSAKIWLPLENCGDHIYNLAWAPDENKIAAFSSGGRVNICDPKTDRLLVRLKGEAEQAERTDLDWSSDGHLLAVSSFRLELISSRLQIAENRVVIWDTRTWQPVRVLEGNSLFYSVAFSPDSKILAIGSNDGTIWLIKL